MRKFFTAALLLCAFSANAQVVYKCVGKGGKTEYSSWPCSKGQRTEKAVVAIPEPARPYVAQPRHVPQQVVTNAFYNAPRQPSARDQAVQNCAAAKNWREAELRRLGLKRTFDDLRRIDDWVNQQCAGL